MSEITKQKTRGRPRIHSCEKDQRASKKKYNAAYYAQLKGSGKKYIRKSIITNAINRLSHSDEYIKRALMEIGEERITKILETIEWS
jgi:hypothetical protein